MAERKVDPEVRLELLKLVLQIEMSRQKDMNRKPTTEEYEKILETYQAIYEAEKKVMNDKIQEEREEAGELALLLSRLPQGAINEIETLIDHRNRQ